LEVAEREARCGAEIAGDAVILFPPLRLKIPPSLLLSATFRLCQAFGATWGNQNRRLNRDFAGLP